ncbi:hypothetical protein M9458_037907, partial [Cirrhinus mrigala]
APATVASGMGPRRARMGVCREERRPLSARKAQRSHGCWSTSERDGRWSRRKITPAPFLCWNKNARWSLPASTYHKP